MEKKEKAVVAEWSSKTTAFRVVRTKAVDLSENYASYENAFAVEEYFLDAMDCPSWRPCSFGISHFVELCANISNGRALLENYCVPNLDLRPAVLKFAQMMERKLQANDCKGGWESDNVEWLLSRLREELLELDAVALNDDGSAETRQKIGQEAADVANYAMMVADVCGSVQKDRSC